MRRLGLHLDATHYNASTRHCFSWSSSAAPLHGLRGGARSSGGTAYLACGRGTEEQGASAERGWREGEDDVGPIGQKGEETETAGVVWTIRKYGDL